MRGPRQVTASQRKIATRSQRVNYSIDGESCNLRSSNARLLCACEITFAKNAGFLVKYTGTLWPLIMRPKMKRVRRKVIVELVHE